MISLFEQLADVSPTALSGSVVRTEGLTMSVAGLPAPVGSVVRIERQAGQPLEGEVIGFRDDHTLVFPLGPLNGIRHGDRVRLVRSRRWLRVGDELLGRVVNAHGAAVDGRPRPALAHRMPLDASAPLATERPPIASALSTGIRAIDGLLTCGCGQRIGIFSGSGVGKSVLLGMIARYTSADVNVIGLIGERGREVNEFLERDLGPTGRARSVVVVATSDEPALVRLQAALTATAIAEYFRDQGRNVLFLLDSVTRFAMAQREIGLAAGEPPATRGYPPSVFALLPRLLERTGRTARGSITAMYSVLVEGDDVNEPISDAARGFLDGHIVLSRKLASQAHYPAIDVLGSISRLMSTVASPEHLQAAQFVRELLAVYREHEDLISIGAYRPGSNRRLDVAIAAQEELNRFLRQATTDRSTVDECRATLLQMAAKYQSWHGATAAPAGAVANAKPAPAVAATGAAAGAKAIPAARSAPAGGERR